MEYKHFQNEAKKAGQYVKEGLDQLIEVAELLESLNSPASAEERTKVIEGIVAKEKYAVSLIQQSTLIQRELMKIQHDEVAKLLETI